MSLALQKKKQLQPWPQLQRPIRGMSAIGIHLRFSSPAQVEQGGWSWET